MTIGYAQEIQRQSTKDIQTAVDNLVKIQSDIRRFDSRFTKKEVCLFISNTHDKM